MDVGASRGPIENFIFRGYEPLLSDKSGALPRRRHHGCSTPLRVPVQFDTRPSGEWGYGVRRHTVAYAMPLIPAAALTGPA